MQHIAVYLPRVLLVICSIYLNPIMPTKRKTSLYIVCFYALFLITSCVNSKKNKVSFHHQDNESQVEVSVINRNETSIRIQLTCISATKNIELKDANIVCLNVNPMSINTMEKSEDERLTQVYDGEYKGNKVRIILPYGNLEKTKHDVVLRIVTTNKDSLEAKLFKNKTQEQA